ncbi:hypothetical protein Vi05172_g8145 [Venturia inaequalis]|nr:hypothetical protein Vi05172_g8145 [Venturia inaequalis]
MPNGSHSPYASPAALTTVSVAPYTLSKALSADHWSTMASFFKSTHQVPPE